MTGSGDLATLLLLGLLGIGFGAGALRTGRSRVS